MKNQKARKVAANICPIIRRATLMSVSLKILMPVWLSTGVTGWWIQDISLLRVLMAGAAGANLITNGAFQDDLLGWDAVGDVRVVDAGGFAALQGMDDNFALFGELGTNGTSTLSQQFFAPRTNVLTVSFNWAFDSIDFSRSRTDRFVSVLTSTGDVFDISMLDITSGGITLDSGFFQESFAIPRFTGGDVVISFSLFEAPGLLSPISFAGIDNVAVVAAPVPIPTTLLLLGSGLICVVGLSRRKMKL